MVSNDIPLMVAKRSFSFWPSMISMVQAVQLCSQFWLCILSRNLHLKHWFFSFLQFLARCPFSWQLKHLGLPLLWAASIVASQLNCSGLSEVFPWSSSNASICFLTAQIAMSIRSTAELHLFCLKTSLIICLETFCSNRYTPKALYILDWEYTVSNKTVPITNLDAVHKAHCKHTWEYRLGLV